MEGSFMFFKKITAKSHEWFPMGYHHVPKFKNQRFLVLHYSDCGTSKILHSLPVAKVFLLPAIAKPLLLATCGIVIGEISVFLLTR